MSVIIKKGMVKFKDRNGTTSSVNVISDQTTAEQVAAIQAAGEETIDSIPEDYTELTNEVSELRQDLTKLDSKINIVVAVSPNLFDEENVQSGRLIVQNTVSLTSNTAYDTFGWFPVEVGDIYTISNCRRLVFGTAIESGRTFVADIEGTNGQPMTVTVPENASFMMFSFAKTATNMMFVKGASLPPYTPYGAVNINKEADFPDILYNRLRGKIGVSFGDSICHGAGNGNNGILDLLHDKYGVIVNDYSVSGETMQKYRSEIGAIPEQINSVNLANLSADFIILDGLSNDVAHSGGTLGTVDSSFDWETNGYTDSFVHALEYCFGKIRSVLPDVPIIYFIAHSTPSRDYTKELNYGNIARDVCKKWSVTVADIYKDGGVNTRIQSQLEMYSYYPTETSGTHPNKAGYEYAYMPIIEDILRRIYT